MAITREKVIDAAVDNDILLIASTFPLNHFKSEDGVISLNAIGLTKLQQVRQEKFFEEDVGRLVVTK